ncbi:MAG: zinc metallopeptidase [Halioglobus sp.]
MVYALLVLAVVVLIYAPQFWVRHVLKKHHRVIDDMPGTGGELAAHLIERFELEEVSLEEGSPDQDHYNPGTSTVSLSPEVFHGKSLSAVAVATHEVGHAIQFSRKEQVSKLREKYLGKAHLIQTWGVYVLMSIPIIGAAFRIPHLAILTALIGVVTMLASVLMYAAILPEEYDASFNKALPILEEGYVPEHHLPAVRQVLKACALTYVAGALADILRLWRWIAIIR